MSKRLRLTAGAVALAAVVLSVPGPAIADHYKWPGTAPYSVSRLRLDAALACKGGAIDGSGVNEPVLLVHGTGINRRLSWDWNYWNQLPVLGFDVCWVQLPKEALGDAQISAEYVARAVERMHAYTGEQVDILGHSQGGLVPRWSIKWFPSAIWVDDYVGLSAPNHGTVVADPACLLGCTAAVWQMQRDSRFGRAVNADDETPGTISYTNVYSAFDELVQPVGTSALAGGTNILIQDVCPGRPVDHAGTLGDAVTYHLVLDALTNPGAADVARFDEAWCEETTMPGFETPPPGAFPDWDSDVYAPREPPLKPYARDWWR